MKYRTSVFAKTIENYYNLNELEGSGGLITELLVLVYIFCGFAVMCDKYLIPAIEKIKVR